MMVPLLFASFGLTDTHITSSRTFVVMYFCLAAFLMAMLERRSAPKQPTPQRPCLRRPKLPSFPEFFLICHTFC